jgi:hypothetical protein
MSVMRPRQIGSGAGITSEHQYVRVFFETDVGYAPRGVVIFAIELDGPADKKIMLSCRA